MKTGPKPRPTIDRLMEKTTKQPDGCWVFNGAVGSQGYGKTYHEGKATDAHRASWIVHNGTIPVDMVVMHTCDVKLCVNPEHLKLGTQKENLADMRRKLRHSNGESHAEAIKRGWTPELRANRGKQIRDMARQKRENAAKEAGVPLDWKYCSKCHEWQPLVNFGKNAARRDGVNVYCNPCRYSKVTTQY